ncbi:site-specific DNA-methyltransferase [Neptunomonas japonica]|uniref:site-specific DNA-methyltransferase n=1 Tax=Neptunomonas japonica TaxID=417574 RepID=UPI0003FE128A|nr:site-specific DNA-methyltransferase [Neptunomonas japonica]
MSEQNTLNLGAAGGVDSVEKYKFEPIKGYPMLHWHGKRPFASTQYYPAQKKEVYGEEINGWINKVFWGDNLQVMSHLLKEYRGAVDLIYIDPPFDSKAEYKKKIKLRGRKLEGGQNSFEEKQYSDIWNNDEYLQFMYERIILSRELLKDTGTMYLHCDYRRSHHLRCIMDEVFGSGNLVSEIVWRRSTSTGSSKARSNKYPSNHDVILMYGKTSGYKYSKQYVPYSEEYVKRFKFDDGDGRGLYRVDNLSTYSQATLQKLKDDNRLVIPKTEGANYGYKRYIKETKGIVVDDVFTQEVDDTWLDINFVNPMAEEGTGYPTQKPETLLERIINTSTEEGDLVFDFFMGSGTTLNAALNAGRRFIGADINFSSVQIATKRILSSIEAASDGRDLLGDLDLRYPSLEVFNVNNYDLFKNPLEAKELLLEILEVDSLSGTVYDGQKDGYMVKILPVNRIATREDLNELISNFPYKVFEKRKEDNPTKPVESIMLVCMGHEPDIRAHLIQESGYKLNVEVVDVLRDKSEVEFKRESECEMSLEGGDLEVVSFYPMNLMQKLSMQKESVGEWRELVESIVIDWNYGGASMEPSVVDVPGKNDFVQGTYEIPEDAGTIKIKITDVLSESYEEIIQHG